MENNSIINWEAHHRSLEIQNRRAVIARLTGAGVENPEALYDLIQSVGLIIEPRFKDSLWGVKTEKEKKNKQ